MTTQDKEPGLCPAVEEDVTVSSPPGTLFLDTVFLSFGSSAEWHTPATLAGI